MTPRTSLDVWETIIRSPFQDSNPDGAVRNTGTVPTALFRGGGASTIKRDIEFPFTSVHLIFSPIPALLTVANSQSAKRLAPHTKYEPG